MLQGIQEILMGLLATLLKINCLITWSHSDLLINLSQINRKAPQQLVNRYELVLCIGSNLGLKFGRERPIRVLPPHLADPKIRKQTLQATK